MEIRIEKSELFSLLMSSKNITLNIFDGKKPPSKDIAKKRKQYNGGKKRKTKKKNNRKKGHRSTPWAKEEDELLTIAQKNHFNKTETGRFRKGVISELARQVGRSDAAVRMRLKHLRDNE